MKRFYILLSISLVMLCACDDGQYDLELLSAEVKGFAPYSVGDTMTFVTSGHDTSKFVVTEWFFNEPCHYGPLAECVKNHAQVLVRFDSVGNSAVRNYLDVSSSDRDIRVYARFYSQNEEYARYSSFYEDILPGVFNTQNEEYTIPRNVKSDSTSTDYLKLVHGRGIVEYTIDGVLWKAVTR
ncbi:MAG: hypothetical protein ACI3Z7_00630 [Candidatus Aphodosoma sp.]